MKDQHESLEALLARAPQIDDDGFTDALMARLPARRPAFWIRIAIPLGSAVVSCAAVAAVPGARELLAEIGLALAGSVGGAGSSLLAIAGVVALLACAAAALAAHEA